MPLVHAEEVIDHRRRAPGGRGDQPRTRVAAPSLFRESWEDDHRQWPASGQARLMIASM